MHSFLFLPTSDFNTNIYFFYFEGMKNFIQHYKEIGRQLDAEKLELRKKEEELEEKIIQVEKNLENIRRGRKKGDSVR